MVRKLHLNMGLLSSAIRFTKTLLSEIEKKKVADEEKKKVMEFPIAGGFLGPEKPTTMAPGPTKARASLRKDEPVQYIQPAKGEQRVQPEYSPTAIAWQQATKAAPVTQKVTQRSKIMGGLLKVNDAKMNYDRVRNNILQEGTLELTVRPVTRSVTSIGLEPVAGVMSLVQGKSVVPQFVPKTDFEKLVFGDRPVNGIFTQVSNTQETVMTIAEKLHLNKDFSTGASIAIAPLFVGGIVGLDLMPIAGEGKNVAKLIAQTDSAEGVLKILTQTFKNTEDELRPIALVLSNVNLEKDVVKVLEGLSTTLSGGKAASALGQEAKKVSITPGTGIGKPPEEVLNYDRLGLTKDEKVTLKTAIDEFGTGILGKDPGVITHEEVKVLAEQMNREGKALSQVITREQQVENMAESLRVSQALAKADIILSSQTATVAEKAAAMEEMLAIALKAKSNSQSTARALEARKIVAEATGDVNKEAEVFAELRKKFEQAGVKLDDVLEEMSNLDYTDRKAVEDFYRSKVKPTLREIWDEYRYNNVLSNPRTQAKNFFSNLGTTFVWDPMKLGVNAAIDLVQWAASIGKIKRTYKLTDVPKYYQGIFTAIPEALGKFKDVMMGKEAYQMLDMKHGFSTQGMVRISDDVINKWKLTKPFFAGVDKFLGSVAKNPAYQKAYKFFKTPTKALEATDRMLMHMISESEKARLIRGGMSEKAATKKAIDIAEDSLFRRGIDPSNKSGQGAFLSVIDRTTAWIDQGRAGKNTKVPGLDLFVLFVRTPMNFAKKFIEYSPFGVVTLYKNSQKQEQIAKMMIGSGVSALGYQMAVEGKTTWGIPSDPEAKDLFFASGRRPYSILVGDRWVPMNYLGPLAYALAFPAAIEYYQNDSPTALTDSQLEKIAKIGSSMAEFFTAQTFVAGVNSWLQLLQGGQDRTFGKALAFNSGQAIPWSGMLRYISTIIDDVYRRSDTFMGALQKDLPYAGLNLTPHQLPTGELSRRNMTSYLAPWDIGQEKVEYEALLKMKTELIQYRDVLNQNDAALNEAAADILYRGNNAKTLEEKKKVGREMIGRPKLIKTVEALQVTQNFAKLSLIQPLISLHDKPGELAQIIYARELLAETPEQKQDLVDDLKVYAEAGLWNEDVIKALNKLKLKEEEETEIEKNTR